MSRLRNWLHMGAPVAARPALSSTEHARVDSPSRSRSFPWLAAAAVDRDSGAREPWTRGRQSGK
eukprot:7874395-Pyramimonas_sp.AAC.1